MRKLSTLLLCLLVAATQLLAQNKTVTGKVTDEKGAPVANASVLVKGSTKGTTTGTDGSFSISVATTAKTLVISSVGFSAKDVIIKATSLNVSLQANSAILDEVVVVAYGSVKKENFTGSAARIKGDDIASRPLTNVATALVGAAPGIQTNAGSGQPGSAPAVRVRGFGSINASNDPLYVVDGVPFSGAIGNINANDVEELTVLKDASSTSLYGARAANGVVLITTRKGKKGSKPNINVSVNRGVSERAIKEYDRVDAFQYYPLMWESYRNSLAYRATNPLTQTAANTLATADIRGLLAYNPFNVANNAIVGIDGTLNPNASLLYRPEDLDWENSISRKGERIDANLNISGANDKTDYFISLGYLDEKSYIVRSDFKRISGRINVNTQATSWFKTGININGTFTKSNTASSTGTTAFVNPFNFTRGIGPIYPIYAYNPASPGNYLLDANGAKQYDIGNNTIPGFVRPGGGYGGRHITAETELNRANFRRNFWGARTYGEISFLKDFKFTTNLSVDVTNRTDQAYGNTFVGDAAPNGSLNLDNQLLTTINFNQILAYKKSIKSHNFDAILGHESYDYQDANSSASRTNQIVSGVYEFTNFSQPGTSTSTTDYYKVEGYFSRLNYNYQSKYFASLSFRRDGSSRFQENVRWGNFWSGSAAWRIDQENFLIDSKIISNLKLRTSYGQTGNDAGIGFYPSQALFNLGRNNAFEPGTIYSSLGNKDLQWEASKQFDVALEFGLFKNRLNGTIEYFKRTSDNLLFDVPLPLSSGAGTVTRNIGSMFNEGIELNLNGDVIKFKGFNWNVNLNLTKLRNEITKLPQDEIISGTKKLKVGYSLYDYWLREYVGVDPVDGAALYRADNPSLAGTRIIKAGDTVTTNQNNGRFSYNGGSAIPDFYGSITNTFTYKSFEFSILATFQKGGNVYDVTYAGLMDPGNYGAALHVDALKAWKKTGDNTNIPRMDAGQRGISNAASTRWLTDASFINIRNVALTYSLPQQILNKLKLKSFRFNITAENLNIFTKRTGMNVEENFTGVTSQAFIPSRIISTGFNITF